MKTNTPAHPAGTESAAPLELETQNLSEGSRRLIQARSTAWACTPGEAVTRILDESLAKHRALAKTSLSLELPAIPTAWKRAAKDLGYLSVEEWAASMLDAMAWPGNRMMITSSCNQNRKWGAAALADGQGLFQWVENTLDAASSAGKSPREGGRE